MTADHLGTPHIITNGGGTFILRHDYIAFVGDLAETLGNIGSRTTAQGYGKPDEMRKNARAIKRMKNRV